MMKAVWYEAIFGIGCAFFAFMLWQTYSTVSMLQKSPRAVASLQSIDNEYDGSADLKFRFTTETNKEVTFIIYESTVGSLKIGSRVNISYSRENPADAIVLNYTEVFGFAFFYLVAGVVGIVIGGGYFVSERLLANIRNKY